MQKRMQIPFFGSSVCRIWNLILRPREKVGWISWWNDGILRTTSIVKTLGVKLSQLCERSNCTLRELFEHDSLHLESNSMNIPLQQKVATVWHELRKIEFYEAKGAQIRAHLQYLKIDDWVSKEFFQRVRTQRFITQFKAILGEDSRVTEPPNITKAFIKHYT